MVHHINPPCYIRRYGLYTPVTPSRCSAQTSTRVINKAIDTRSPLFRRNSIVSPIRSGMAILSLCLFRVDGEHERKYTESNCNWIEQLTDIAQKISTLLINKHLETCLFLRYDNGIISRTIMIARRLYRCVIINATCVVLRYGTMVLNEINGTIAHKIRNWSISALSAGNTKSAITGLFRCCQSIHWGNRVRPVRPIVIGDAVLP